MKRLLHSLLQALPDELFLEMFAHSSSPVRSSSVLNGHPGTSIHCTYLYPDDYIDDSSDEEEPNQMKQSL